MRHRRKKLPEGLHEGVIKTLSHEGRGIATIQDKTTFIDNALPGETVRFRYTGTYGKYDEGFAEEIVHPSPDRIIPKCPYFLTCGGCSLQHLTSLSQRQLKEHTLYEQLQYFGKTKIPELLEPLVAKEWGYRRKARLSVRYVEKKQKVLVGFREKHSHYLVDMDYCDVLHPNAAKLILPLKEFILTLDAFREIPQIEVAVDDKHVALVFRHMCTLSESDLHKLTQFAKTHQLFLYLQPKGPDTIHLLYPENTSPLLHYELSDYGITQTFMPSDFAQVNLELNYQMIKRTLDFLELNPHDLVLDLFCGFGNFTLPIAKHAAEVVGIEGSTASIERAQYNATLNHITNVEFHSADLNEPFEQHPWAKATYNKIVLDPPRSGAEYCVSHIERFKAERLVYISCNPATLARDTGILLQKGYTLIKAGIMDMFPHTNHVESIAVFNHGKVTRRIS